MSVLIKGMEMPKSCGDCWALDEYGDYPVCRITKEQRGYNFRTRERQMDNCPLIEIPPHGRLIDADALDKAFTNLRWDKTGDYVDFKKLHHWGDRKNWCLQGNEIEKMFKNAPTIIEAEVEE